MADAVGGGPAVVALVGVIPEWIQIGVVLSPQVEASMGRAVRAVVQAVAALGVALVCRDPPAATDIWWARPRPAGVTPSCATRCGTGA